MELRVYRFIFIVTLSNEDFVQSITPSEDKRGFADFIYSFVITINDLLSDVEPGSRSLSAI